MGTDQSYMTRYYKNQLLEDSTLYEYRSSIYEHLPYIRDRDLCNPSSLKEYGTGIIHRYRFDTKPYIIDPH